MTVDKTSLESLRIDRSAAPRSNASFVLLFVLLLIAAGGGGAYWWMNRPKQVVVRLHTVTMSNPSAERTLLNGSGYVTARRKATVSSKSTGKVVEVLVEEGMVVKEGQVLANLDASNIERNLELAKAQVETIRLLPQETKVQLDQAELDLRRVERLVATKDSSESELEQAQTDVKAIRARYEKQLADVAVAERELAIWQQQLDDTIIRAPFSGVVISKAAQPGEMISPVSAGGGFTRTGICTIVDMDSLEIEVDVNESYINRVTPDMPVEATLDSYPNWKIPAKVIAIIPTADRQKATVKVRVGFLELDSRILPDMSVKVAFQSSVEGPAPQPEMTIPAEAVRKDGEQSWVWLVRDGKAMRREITAGETRGQRVVVSNGLSTGDRIIVEGGENLADGAAVTEGKS